MNSGELLLSNEAFVRIFFFLAYIPVFLISCKLLFPAMSPSAKRLGISMLALQILLVALSELIQPSSIFEQRLWALDREFNIPSTFSSTQLALAGGLALLTAWLARARPAFVRLYLAGIGLVFLYLALDEFFAWKDLRSSRTWKINVSILGAAIVLATILVAMRSSRREKMWHLCLLTGLALVAIAAVVVDDLPPVCGNLGFLRLEDCLDYRIPEEILELVGVWLTLVAMLGHYSDATLMSSPRVQSAPYALPPIWIALIFLIPLVPRFEMQLLAQSTAVQFDKRLQLKGYRIDNGGRGSVILRFYATASAWDWNHVGRREVGYSVHLVDQASGESVASRNEFVRPQFEVLIFGREYEPIYREFVEIKIPPQTPVNRALWVVLTLWREKNDEYEQLNVLSSDLKLLSETQVVLGELVLPADKPAPSTVARAQFDNGITLGAVELPERARPGENLIVPFSWQSDEDGRDDLVQYLHLLHEESGEWFVYDQQPLGSRLPTRLWYRGLADTETWQVPVPADLEPGKYRVFTGLYRAGDQQRVPATDVDGTPFVDARVPIGAITIEA